MFMANVHCLVETKHMKHFNSSVCSLIMSTTDLKTVVQYKTRDEHKRNLTVKQRVDNKNFILETSELT